MVFGNKALDNVTLTKVLQNANIAPEEFHLGSDLGGQISIDLSASGINVDKIGLILKLIVSATQKGVRVLDDSGSEIFSILPSGNIRIGDVEITATPAEMNKLAGATVTTVELNKLAGATLSTAELNKLTGATLSTAELNKLTGVTVTTAEINRLANASSEIQAQITAIHAKYALTEDLASSEITALQNIGALTIILTQWTMLAKASEGANILKIGNVLIQWGSASPSGGEIVVNFATAYTSTPFIYATEISGLTSSASAHSTHVNARSTTACTIQVRLINDTGAGATDVTDATGDVMWLAIGIKTN